MMPCSSNWARMLIGAGEIARFLGRRPLGDQFLDFGVGKPPGLGELADGFRTSKNESN